MKKLQSLMIGLLIGAGISVSANAAMSADEAIAERIKPVGEVCLQGDECASAAPVAAAAASGPRSAEDIYNTKCMACHATGAAGAPKVGDVAAWSARVDEKGVDMLIANAINGINAMPAKGTCGDCSDDEIGDTVKYMVENSK